MNSEYGQSSSRENSVEQRKPMEELKRINQPNSAPENTPQQPIQPIVIQCDLPQAMNKLTEQADSMNWELEEIRKTLPELKPYIDLTPVQQSLAEMQRSLTEMNKLLERVGNLSEKYSSKWIDCGADGGALFDWFNRFNSSIGFLCSQFSLDEFRPYSEFTFHGLLAILFFV